MRVARANVWSRKEVEKLLPNLTPPTSTTVKPLHSQLTVSKMRRVLAAALLAAAAAAAAHAADTRAVSASFLRAGRRALARARSEAEPTCGGLVKEMCKPCEQGGPAEFCDKVSKECADIFCTPMCRKNTWACEVKFSGEMKEEAGAELAPKISEALCGEFKAQGCSKIFDCCQDNEELYDYVENEAFQRQVPEALFPTPSCLEGPTEKLCSACKAGAKVELKPHECPYPSPEGGSGDAEPKTYATAKGSDGKEFPGVNAHKGLQERCLKLEDKVKEKFSSMTTTFQDNLCMCMGCCEGECFFPVTERFTPGGFENGV